MVRIPSLARHSEPAPTRDENRDGRLDTGDERSTGVAPPTRTGPRAKSETEPTRTEPTRTEPTRTEPTRTEPTRTEPTRVDRGGADDTAKHRARGAVAERDTISPPAPPGTTSTDIRPEVDRPTEPEQGLGERPETTTYRPDVPAGPRPRASLLATLSLVFGVAAAGFVLTGALAGYGIVLGTLALLFGVGGVSATARRHIAGKSDALTGLVLGVGAVVVAVLAMTGQFDWPSTDGDTVVRFREWLDSQFVDRF